MRLLPSRKEETVVLHCSGCGFEKFPTSPVATLPKVIEHSPQEQIAVIGKKEAELRTLPKVKVECPKCNNMEAYWWLAQTRGSDESTTQFFRCTKCSYTWREYS